LDYSEILINPSNYTINLNDEGIILSPNKEEVNSLLNIYPPKSGNLTEKEGPLNNLHIKNEIHESKGKLIHNYYLMRECISN